MIVSPFVALVLLFNAPSALAGAVQISNIQLPDSAATNKAAVVDIFTRSYDAYRQYAFGHDDLEPVSKTSTDDRNGWGATIVDAMDTMSIMGLDDFLEEAINFTSQIDFSVSKTGDTVSLFETTIRYIGGTLAAYELINKTYPALVDTVRVLGDKMAFAYSQGNVIPFRFMDFSDNSPTVEPSVIAEAGTLSMEWETLSKYTGNATYGNLAIGSVAHIAGLPAPLPGLAAQGIDPTTGEFIGGSVTWGAGSDSYFEYLIKYARLTNTDNNLFADTWATAVDSSIKYLLRTSTVGNYSYLADFDSSTISHVGSHLACFYGGNWLFGGRLLNNQTIVDIALQLVDACWNTYASTASGIGPETFAYISSDGSFTGNGGPDSQQLKFYNEHGFYITGTDYILRPEVLESNFYAFRVTGDTKYLDRAASAINSFNEYLATPSGFAGLNDVSNPTTGGLSDETQSFWFAEVLKYLYLTFDDPENISLDEYVFNTEGHPFEAPPLKAQYGSGQLLPAIPGFAPKSVSAPLPAVSST